MGRGWEKTQIHKIKNDKENHWKRGDLNNAKVDNSLEKHTLPKLTPVKKKKIEKEKDQFL